MQNIKWHNSTITKEKRALLKNQKPCILWLTGLSGSGKSTLANALEVELHMLQKHTMLLDGDNVRYGLCKDLGFDANSRAENMRRIAEVSKLFLDAGIIVICAFISPLARDREIVREITKECFIEIFVDTPLQVCEERDVKGLYTKARNGEIKDFTGIQSPYEIPQNPEIYCNNDSDTINENVNIILDYLKQNNYL